MIGTGASIFQDTSAVFTRQLDDQGRIRIPPQIRDALDWNTGTDLDICMNDIKVKSITIKQSRPVCAICRGSKNLFEINGRCVCYECANQIAENLKKE